MIHSTGDGTGYQDILDVFSCFQKNHLPMLTALIIDNIYYMVDLVAIVNACLTHFKHLRYLQLGKTHDGSMSTKTNEELSTTSSPMVGRGFHVTIVF
jgi:hypothetical protein